MGEARLRCISGDSVGQVIELGDELIIGRSAPSPGDLGNDPQLSRRHARITYNGSRRAIVEDLGSSNGTFVNGQRIERAHQLDDGDEIRVGRTTLAFEQRNANAQRAAAMVSPTAPPTPTPISLPAPPPRQELVLTVTAGPLRGREITVLDEFLIGRSFGGEGNLGGERSLSRRHARIVLGFEGGFFVEDTGSSNGTFVDGKQIRAAQPLSDGTEIKVGATTLRVSLHATPIAARRPASAEHEEPAPVTGDLGAPPGEVEQVPVAAYASAASQGAYVPRGAAGSRLATRKLLAVFVAVFAAAVGVAILAVALVAPPGPRICPKGRTCQPHPKVPALFAEHVYSSPLGWSVEYAPQLFTVSQQDASHVKLLSSKSGAAILIATAPAAQVTPQAAIQSQVAELQNIVIGLTTDQRPEDQMFGIPAVGLHDGIAGVYGGTVNTSQGAGAPVVVELVATRDSKLTLVMTAIVPAGGSTAQRTNPGLQAADSVLETVRLPSDQGV